MLTRVQLEKTEDETLSSYAQKASQSKGRHYPEPEHPYRTSYQRDRDRIIHCAAFRRLQYKTQVFVNHEGDYYRTRITHTIEVDQIARSIARTLGLNQDLTEAIALAHDLGHTPFGHSGEKVLDEIMKQDGGFEHNAQSYRIVTHLENRYPQFNGLNLTYEVLEGVDKHHTRYDHPGGNGDHSTLEAQIVDLADEVAYTTHDIDDGLTSGLLSPEKLMEVRLWKRLMGGMKQARDEMTLDKVKYQAVRRIIDEQVTDLLTETTRRIEAHGIRSVEDVRQCQEPLAGFSSTVQLEHQEMKQYLYQNLYRHPRVTKMEIDASKVIQELFLHYESHPDGLPANTREKIKNQQEPIRRIICDYIAGMTDRYAIEEHKKLIEPFARK